MNDDARRCTAMSKHTGERCRQPAVPGTSVCRYHGARGGAPAGNLNALVHGAYAQRILSAEEQRIHSAFLDQIRQDFALNRSSDEIQVQMAALAFLQYLRAGEAGTEAAAAVHARIVRNCLRDLRATKSARERGPVDLQMSPSEWATAFVAKALEADGKRKRRTEKSDGKGAESSPGPAEHPGERQGEHDGTTEL